MVGPFDQDQIKGRIVRPVAVDVVNVKPVRQLLAKPLLGSVSVSRQPSLMIILHARIQAGKRGAAPFFNRL